MPAIQPYIIDPIWQQLRALLPERETNHPLGCHRPRIPDRVVFEKLVAVLFSSAAPTGESPTRSARPPRSGADEWIEAGVMDALEEMARQAYDRAIGLDLSDAAVDCA